MFDRNRRSPRSETGPTNAGAVGRGRVRWTASAIAHHARMIAAAVVACARSWGMNPLAYRLPWRRKMGLVAVLAAGPLLVACAGPSGDGGIGGPPPTTPPPSCKVNPAVAYWASIGGDSRVDVSALGSDCSLTATNVSYHGYEAAGVPASWLAVLRRGYDAEFMDAVHARLMGRGMSVEKAQAWIDGYGADGAISYDNWLVATRNIEEHERAFDRDWLDPALDQFLTPPNLPTLTHWFIEDFRLPKLNDEGGLKDGISGIGYMDWSAPGKPWFGFPQLAGLLPDGVQAGQDFNGFDLSSYWPYVLDEHGGVVQAHHSFPFPSFVKHVIPLYFGWPDNYDHQVGLQSRRGVDFSADTLDVSEVRWEATHGNGPAPDADGYFRPEGIPLAPGEFVMPSDAGVSDSLGQWLFNVSTINVDPRDPRDPEGLVNYDVVVEAPSGEWPGAVPSFLRSGYDQIDVFWEYPDTDLNLMMIDYRVNRPVFDGSEFVGWDYSGHLPLGPTPRFEFDAFVARVDPFAPAVTVYFGWAIVVADYHVHLLECEIDPGDGGQPVLIDTCGRGGEVVHEYATAGEYVATMTVSDGYRAESRSISVTAIVD